MDDNTMNNDQQAPAGGMGDNPMGGTDQPMGTSSQPAAGQSMGSDSDKPVEGQDQPTGDSAQTGGETPPPSIGGDADKPTGGLPNDPMDALDPHPDASQRDAA